MFEFHGWARVESTSGHMTSDDDDGLHYPDKETLYRELLHELDGLSETLRECVDLRCTVNGLVSLTVSGLVNHRREAVFRLFEWLAEKGRRSTGVLFTRDDEDDDRDYDFMNEFRVFRLSHGTFKELDAIFQMPENPELPPRVTSKED